MNPVAARLLNMTARDVIGTVVKFRSPRSLRVRAGKIRGISATGVRVATSKGDPFVLTWGDLLEIVEPKGVKA